MKKLTNFALVILVSCGSATAANLVTNGNFEGGNTGFQSQYTSAAVCSGVNAEGIYSVTPLSCFPLPDPTNAGNVFVANGGTDKTQYVWRQDIQVTKNQKYYFSAKAASIGTVNPPIIKIQNSTDGACAGAVAYNDAGVINATTTSLEFVTSTGLFVNGNASDLCLRLLNDNDEAAGNDYILDDIFLDSVYSVSTNVPLVAGGSASCIANQQLPGALPNEVLNGAGASCSATTNNGYSFTGWTGACTGTGACNISSVGANLIATANFVLIAAPTGPNTTAQPIPTLSEWTLIFLSILIGGIALTSMKKKQV